MIVPGIDTAQMTALNQNRLNGLSQAQAMERLSTGLRVNRGADDPSGLGIGKGMAAQIRGISTAIHNLEEGIDLIRTADGALSEIHDILMRQRDIAVRGANEATLYTNTSTNPNEIQSSPTRDLFNELMYLDIEIYETVRRHRFNTKQMLFGYEFGQALQAGPDNQSSHRIDVTIPDLSIMGTSVPIALPGNITHSQFVAAFQNAIDVVTQDIDTISDARALLGEQEIRINHAIDDLTQEYIHITAAKSHIMDSDLAEEMVSLTTAQIKDVGADMAVQQSTASQSIIFTLMDAVGLDASQRVK